ncbi:DUF3563 domain-containing protein [Rhodoferax lacus]|uniref:DUF3563 domain-containing protein n=1 Tax=Rhodoferax lacus TaxID=2184758 RepID=A0A3E1RCU1_9BURK|nr:DUF3563 family protein [Rhodoferax lacus]RFO97187.1 DUF3563 domain-containing protein [Rhodoferax lacus]
MSHFVEFIKTLVPHFPSQQELDEQYLSESVDVYDVERRIFEIDHRGSQTEQQGIALGGALH